MVQMLQNTIGEQKYTMPIGTTVDDSKLPRPGADRVRRRRPTPGA